jgi:hypothetical protein
MADMEQHIGRRAGHDYSQRHPTGHQFARTQTSPFREPFLGASGRPEVA